MVGETQYRSSELLYEFTANLVKVFEIRGTILGKLDLQKTVYFMKRLGVEIPFEFRWNILGPYSYELGHYLSILEIKGLLSYSGTYKINEEEAELYKSYLTLSSEMINRIKSFFNNMHNLCTEKNYNKVNFIECAASLDFINQNVTKEKSKDIVFSLLEKLKAEKKKLFSEIREDAWEFLRSEGLLAGDY